MAKLRDVFESLPQVTQQEQLRELIAPWTFDASA